MLQLLRPNSSSLPCLYSTFHLEYPLVLSRFCSVSDWLRHFRLLLRNHWTEFLDTWHETRSKLICILQILCFSNWSEKPRWPPLFLIDWDILDFSASAECNLAKLYRRQVFDTLHQVCRFTGRSLSAGVSFQKGVFRCISVALWAFCL